MEDQQIIYWLKKDPNKGITAIMNKYGGLLVRLSQNTGLLKKEDQEECISDILYHVWRKAEHYDQNKSSFKTWLILLARGCSVDYVRKNKNLLKTIPYEDLDDMKVIKGEEEFLNIMDLMQQLPYPDNEIFFKRFVIGESAKNIAEQVHLSVDNVYKRIQRGREKLKDLIKQEGL